MGVRLAVAVALAACSFAPGAASAAEFEGASASFRFRGSHGYSIAVSAFSDRADGRGWVSIAVAKHGDGATYSVPALVTESALHADLGALGRIDAIRRGSGVDKTVRVKCVRTPITYEPAVYEGAFEFSGEGGYTRLDESSAAVSPLPFLGSCGGSGRGEELNSDRLPGARLKGISYADGCVLKFQVNKNRPDARVVFTASLRERRRGIRIYRTLSGTAPAGAFGFPHNLWTAKLAPPAPFSGHASLARSRNSVLPSWSGDLALDFLGAPRVPLAGPGAYVTLVHARFTRGHGASVHIGSPPGS